MAGPTVPVVVVAGAALFSFRLVVVGGASAPAETDALLPFGRFGIGVDVASSIWTSLSVASVAVAFSAIARSLPLLLDGGASTTEEGPVPAPAPAPPLLVRPIACLVEVEAEGGGADVSEGTGVLALREGPASGTAPAAVVVVVSPATTFFLGFLVVVVVVVESSPPAAEGSPAVAASFDLDEEPLLFASLTSPPVVTGAAGGGVGGGTCFGRGGSGRVVGMV